MERVAWWGIWWAFPLGLKIVGRIQANRLKFPCDNKKKKKKLENPLGEAKVQTGAQQTGQCTTFAVVCALQQVTPYFPFLDHL